MKKILMMISVLFALSVYAQDIVPTDDTPVEKNLASRIHEMDPNLLLLVVLVIGIVIAMFLVVSVLSTTLINVMNLENRKLGRPEIHIFDTLKKRFITGEVLPIEKNAEIQLSHNYDGIVELDNTMPPWLRAVFGITIVVAISYLAYYYVLDMGKFQLEEYADEMEQAKVEMAAYQKKAANSINEDNVTLITNVEELALAQELYTKNCKTCHGAQAEGGAGPNLTDEYWIHGGSVKEIFKTVKYGVPAKGMIAWQQKLTSKDIQSLTSYIVSLKGTNPPGAKAPQGELYNAEVSDTTTVAPEAL